MQLRFGSIDFNHLMPGVKVTAPLSGHRTVYKILREPEFLDKSPTGYPSTEYRYAMHVERLGALQPDGQINPKTVVERYTDLFFSITSGLVEGLKEYYPPPTVKKDKKPLNS